jgi:hypothetical protein
MQFRVPQFIDVKDKIFGQLTFVQFVYLAGGAATIYLLFKLLPTWLAIIPAIIIAVLVGLLAFYKINDKPFIDFLKAGSNYLFSSKLYLWKQRPPKPDSLDKKNSDSSSLNQMTTIVPMVSASKLKDLSWSLDVEEKK